MIGSFFATYLHVAEYIFANMPSQRAAKIDNVPISDANQRYCNASRRR